MACFSRAPPIVSTWFNSSPIKNPEAWVKEIRFSCKGCIDWRSGFSGALTYVLKPPPPRAFVT